MTQLAILRGEMILKTDVKTHDLSPIVTTAHSICLPHQRRQPYLSQDRKTHDIIKTVFIQFNTRPTKTTGEQWNEEEAEEEKE